MNGSRRHFIIKGSSLAAIGAGLVPGREAAAQAKATHRVTAFASASSAARAWAGPTCARPSRRRASSAWRSPTSTSRCSTSARRTRFVAGGKTPRLYRDYRKLLADKEVDAVIVGTPDHWHCLILVDALAAGKHVYVEKPVANSIEEARLMLAAARRSGRVVQVGQWQRSAPAIPAGLEDGPIRDARQDSPSEGVGVPGLDGARARAARLGPSRRCRLRHVARPRHEAALQPQPLPLQLPVVLGLRRRADDRLGRPRDRHRPLGHGREGPEVGDGLRRQGRLPRRRLGDPRHAPGRVRVRGFNMLWEHATGIDGGNYGRTEGIAFIGNKAPWS